MIAQKTIRVNEKFLHTKKDGVKSLPSQVFCIVLSIPPALFAQYRS